MADAQTWRVVLADGSVREVRVEASPEGRAWAESADGAAEGAGADAWLAVMRVARFLGVSVREILAPGEPTRAELVAQLADALHAAREAEYDERCADTDRAIAEEVSSALYLAARAAGYAGGDHWNEGDGTKRGEEMLALVRATARREGAEAMREACAALCDRRAREHDEDADMEDDEDAEQRRYEALAVADAIRALPLDAPSAPGEVSNG